MSNVKCKMSKHAKCHKCTTCQHVKTVKHVKLPTSSNDKSQNVKYQMSKRVKEDVKKCQQRQI